MGSRFHAKTPAFAKASTFAKASVDETADKTVGKQRHKEEDRGRQYLIFNFRINYEKREKILEGRPPCRPHSTNDYE